MDQCRGRCQLRHGPARAPGTSRLGPHGTATSALLATLWAVSGCGSALPSLLTPHTLAPGKVEASLGAAAALQIDASKAPTASLTRTVTTSPVQGLALARVGIPANNEIWVLGSGGTTALGVRHAWQSRNWATSVGLEGTWAQLSTRNLSAPAAQDPRDVWRAAGPGVALPVTFGWRHATDLVGAWVGARGRFTALDVEADEKQGRVYDGAAAAWLGLSVGVYPLWARVELQAEYHRLRIRPDVPESAFSRATRDAFVLTPSTAIAVRF